MHRSLDRFHLLFIGSAAPFTLGALACGELERSDSGGGAGSSSAGSSASAAGDSSTGGASGGAGGGIMIERPDVAAKLPECNHPMDPGSCTDFEQRFYYDAEAIDCIAFMYGACEGNDNNFASRAECLDFCMGWTSCSCSEEAPACDTTRCEKCPADLGPADGMACEELGLRCERERNSCACIARKAGDPTWECQLIPL